MRRTTVYTRIPTQFRDVRLPAIACQLFDWLAGPSYAPLSALVELVVFCGRISLLGFYASIAARIVGSPE